MIGFKQNSLAQFEIYLKARIKNYFLYEYGPILPFFFVDKDYFYKSPNDQPLTLKEGAEKAFEDFYFLYEYGLFGDGITDIVNGSGAANFRDVIKFGPFQYYQMAAKYLFDNNMVAKFDSQTWENSPYTGEKIKESYLVQLFFQEFYLFLKQINISASDKSLDNQQDYSYLRSRFFSGGKRTSPSWSDIILKKDTAKGSEDKFIKSLQDTQEINSEDNPCCKFQEKIGPLFPNDKPKDADGDFNSYWTEEVPSRTDAATPELQSLENKLIKIRNEVADFNPDEEDVLDELKKFTPAERCYLCKRFNEFGSNEGTSMLAVLERVFDTGAQRQDLKKVIKCSDFGWKDAQGFNDDLANDSDVEINSNGYDYKLGKCKKQETTPGIENYNSARQSIQASDFKRAFRNKVDEMNVRIDKALITVIDGV